MGTEKHVLPDTSDMLSNRVKKSMAENAGDQQPGTIFGPNNRPISQVDMEIAHDITKTKTSKRKSPNPFSI